MHNDQFLYRKYINGIESEESLFDVECHLNENLKIAETAVLTEMMIHDVDFEVTGNYPDIKTSISQWSTAGEDEEEKITIWFTFPDRHISDKNYEIEDKINEIVRSSELIKRLERRFGGEIEVYATYDIERMVD
jgi:hypothetical protein